MKLQDLKTVAVIGAGDMGHGIAQLAVMAGYDVNLCDIKAEFVERGMSRIFASMEKLVSKGRCPAEALERAWNGALKPFTDTAEAVKNADFIIEVVAEKVSVKESVLRAASEAAREDAIIATNTSTMSITMLSNFVKKPERFIGTHYFNPAVLMKLVEVINGDKTAEETSRFALDYAQKVGKISVYAKKDTPGFIANRIFYPAHIYNCACIEKDGVTPEDIDASMMNAGLKMGPMELIDYTGVDITASCFDYYCEHLSKEFCVPKVLADLLAQGKLGKKSGEGFYKWVDGARPAISKEAATGRYNSDLFFYVQANEATKLYEQGVCSLEDCDKAMKYGYNTPGPIEYIRNHAAEDVAKALAEISEHFGIEVFKPTKTISSGDYK